MMEKFNYQKEKYKYIPLVFLAFADGVLAFLLVAALSGGCFLVLEVAVAAAVVEFEATEDVILSTERRLISDLSDLVEESVSLLLRTLLLFSTISPTWFVRGAEVASVVAAFSASLFSKPEDVVMEVEAVEAVVVTEAVVVKVGSGTCGSSLISVEDNFETALVEDGAEEAVANKGLSRLPPPTKLCSGMAGDLLARGCLDLGMDFFCEAATALETCAAVETSISRGCSEVGAAPEIEALNMLFLFMLSITSFIDIPAPLLRPGGGSKTGRIESDGPKLIGSLPPSLFAAVDGVAVEGWATEVVGVAFVVARVLVEVK